MSTQHHTAPEPSQIDRADLALIRIDPPGLANVPDEYERIPNPGWTCRHCRSEWARPSAHSARIRLLHRDETCPCFGQLCRCYAEGGA